MYRQIGKRKFEENQEIMLSEISHYKKLKEESY